MSNLELSPTHVRQRYQAAVDQIRHQFPSGMVTSTGVKTTPFSPQFEEADLYLGSRVDGDPKSEDKVWVMSYHREPTGGETIVDECFTERQERPHLFSGKSQVLHAYARTYHSPGGILQDAALLSLDLKSGEVLRSLTGGEACEAIWDLGLDRRS